MSISIKRNQRIYSFFESLILLGISFALIGMGWSVYNIYTLLETFW